MGISILPDFGPQLAQAFANIGGGLSRTLNPFQDLQGRAREAILQNPEVGRQLAELERQTPGTVDRLLGLPTDKASGLYRMIMGLQPSSNIMVENLTREALRTQTPDLGEIASRVTTGMNRGQVATSGAVAGEIGRSPTEAGQQLLFGGPKKEFTAAEKVAELKGQVNDYAIEWLNAQGLDDKRKFGAYASIQGLLDEHQFHEELDSREKLQRLRTKDEFSEWEKKNQIDEANWWVRTTGVSDTKTWQQFLTSDVARADAYAGKDPKLKEIADAFRSVGIDKLAIKSIRLQNEIDEAVNYLTAQLPEGRGLRNRDPNLRKQSLAKLQTALNFRSFMYKTENVKVFDKMTGLFKGTPRLQFVREDGSEITIEDLSAITPLPPEFLEQQRDEALSTVINQGGQSSQGGTTSRGSSASSSRSVNLSGLSPVARRAWMMYQGMANKDTALAQLKQAPGLYSELKQAGLVD